MYPGVRNSLSCHGQMQFTQQDRQIERGAQGSQLNSQGREANKGRDNKKTAGNNRKTGYIDC